MKSPVVVYLRTVQEKKSIFDDVSLFRWSEFYFVVAKCVLLPVVIGKSAAGQSNCQSCRDLSSYAV
jgi:hypothetical protein